MMEYEPAILATAPRAFRSSLELSERMDGHRRHSLLSVAVELGVYPDRVFDTAQQMIAAVCIAEKQLDPDELHAAVFAGPRYAGSIDLPVGHPGGDWCSDWYLTDDAVVYVFERIRAASFDVPSPAVTPRARAAQGIVSTVSRTIVVTP